MLLSLYVREKYEAILLSVSVKTTPDKQDIAKEHTVKIIQCHLYPLPLQGLLLSTHNLILCNQE